jgi:hypothetical protein
VKVLCWNLGGAFGRWRDDPDLRDRAWHWIAALDPDLALLQECVPPTWACDRWTILTLPYMYWASALVARPSLGLHAIAVAGDTPLGRFGSYLATGEIEVADGPSLLVASVHTRAAEAPDWVTGDLDRAAIARSTVGVPWSNDVAFDGYRSLVQDRRFLVGGDWNTARYIDADGTSDPAGAEFFSRAAAAGWSEITLDGDGCEGKTWYGSGAPRPYQPDHVFADPGTAATLRGSFVEAYPVERLGLSDHAPLVLDLDVPTHGDAGGGS